MAIVTNPTKSNLQKQLDADIELKNKLAIPFKRDIKAFLRRVNNDFDTQYTSTGTVINVSRRYTNDLIAILSHNYRRVTKKFKFNIRETFDAKEIEIDSTKQVSREVDAKINNVINEYINDVSLTQASFILTTTQNDINNFLRLSVQTLVEEEQRLTTEAIADETRKELNKRAEGRATIISIQETQQSAEASKDIEQKILVRESVVLGGIALATSLIDIWISFLDEHTRPSHVQANGQEKTTFQTFTVGGASLRFPGDPLGPLREIMGCRCSKITIIRR